MFEALIIATLTAIFAGQVADVPNNQPRKTMNEALDCAADSEEWVSYCIFPEKEDGK